MRLVIGHEFEREARVAVKFILDRGKGGREIGPGQGLSLPWQHSAVAGA